ncbi:MAG: tRNA pseudouridine(55) synthase TruB, partial [Clostridia bacterium]
MLKKIFPKMKIGHTGTLDPIAEGVLVVCIGKATRIADYIQATRKIYKAQMILGLDSDSYDITGQILCKIPADGIQNQEILKAINSFIGKQSQKPPIYSAKKVNGKKLYEYAYNKQEVQINESYIEITYIDKIIIENILYENIPMKRITFEV